MSSSLWMSPSDHRNYRAGDLLPNNVTASGIPLACIPVPRIELWILLWRCLARLARVDDAAIGHLACSGLCSSHLSAQARLYLPSLPNGEDGLEARGNLDGQPPVASTVRSLATCRHSPNVDACFWGFKDAISRSSRVAEV